MDTIALGSKTRGYKIHLLGCWHFNAFPSSTHCWSKSRKKKEWRDINLCFQIFFLPIPSWSDDRSLNRPITFSPSLFMLGESPACQPQDPIDSTINIRGVTSVSLLAKLLILMRSVVGWFWVDDKYRPLAPDSGYKQILQCVNFLSDFFPSQREISNLNRMNNNISCFPNDIAFLTDVHNWPQKWHCAGNGFPGEVPAWENKIEKRCEFRPFFLSARPAKCLEKIRVCVFWVFIQRELTQCPARVPMC